MKFSSGLFGKKSTWVGISAIAGGIGICVAGDYATGIQTILGGFAIIAGRDTVLKVTGQ